MNMFFRKIEILAIVVLMSSMVGSAQKRIVWYLTYTKTFYAIPSCVKQDEINDLDLVSMITEEPLIEQTQEFISDDNHLTVTVSYPQKPRYEYDYKYMKGRMVFSKEGTWVYDHHGNEIAFEPNKDKNSFLIDESISRSYGIYNDIFEVDFHYAVEMLSKAGFKVYKSNDDYLTGINDMMEIVIDFKNFIYEIRFFEKEQLKMIERTQYIKTKEKGAIIPYRETIITYNTLPSSNIPYQITKEKSYSFYEVRNARGEIIVKEGNAEVILKTSDKQEKNIQLGQYEEIEKRKMEMKVYPNPAEEQITITLPFYMNDDVSIDIINIMGVSVLSEQHVKGNQVKLNIHSLIAGVYIIRCTQDNKSITARFIKQ
ncbi:MAG: T9SS type A sorting domain-containing protein [Bacteroidales bacterium]|jgi:hypothetical protein|nr:T9SS type A sorting domain-containing protein [Bacteroidales bacterium]